MINIQHVLQTYQRLVLINSYPKNERKIADILKNELITLNCKVKEDSAGKNIGGNTGNIIADFPAENNRTPKLLLSAHMDRIKKNNNIEITINNNIIYGNQGYIGGDDLVGIVTILEILYQQNKYLSEHASLKIIFTVAEELGLLGAKNLSNTELTHVKYGLVFDAEGYPGTIINHAPYYYSINIIIKGRYIKNIYQVSTAVITKINTGKINSEMEIKLSIDKRCSYNSEKVYCDHNKFLKLKIEILSFNYLMMNYFLEDIKNSISEIANSCGCEAKYFLDNCYEGYKIDDKNNFLKNLQRSAENVNLPFKMKNSFGGSDANVFNQFNIPTVNLSTGLQNAHTLREIVNLEDIKKNAEYSLEIIRNLQEK